MLIFQGNNLSPSQGFPVSNDHTTCTLLCPLTLIFPSIYIHITYCIQSRLLFQPQSTAKRQLESWTAHNEASFPYIGLLQTKILAKKKACRQLAQKIQKNGLELTSLY